MGRTTQTVFSVGDKLNTFQVMVVNQALLNLGGKHYETQGKGSPLGKWIFLRTLKVFD